MAAREVSPEAAITAGLPLTGTLDQASTIRLFGLAAASQATGELSLTTGAPPITYTLFFRRGTVEHAGSSDPADDLGRFLVRKGILTPEKLVMAEAARPAAGGDLVGALVATRLVNPGDVAGLLLERGAGVVTRALSCEAGSFSWEPGVQPPPSSFPLGAPFAALCTAMRALDVSAAQRRLGARASGAASRMVGRIKLDDLRLTPQEARAVGLFDGARSPAEIAAALPADAGIVLRLALLLGDLDLLTFGPPRAAPPQPPSPSREAGAKTGVVSASPPTGARAGDVPSPTPTREAGARAGAVSPPSPPAPAGGEGRGEGALKSTPPAQPRPPAVVTPRPVARPTPAPAPSQIPPRPREAGERPSAALDTGALRALLDKQAGADHFQVLGLKRDAPLPAVKAAYFQMARSYHPDAVPADSTPEVRKLCADVFARLSEAWAVLGDEGRRAKYLEELQSGGAADVDVMKILHAENLFQEGTALVKARRYDDALARLGEATQLNPDEAEFGIWKAWCEFLVAADKKRQHGTSAGVIEAGLKKNPKCAPGYLFLGQMAKVVGDLNLAERHLKRGLSAAPDHPDIMRELKYLRK